MLSLLCLALVAGTATANSLVAIDVGTEFMKIGIVKPGVPIDIVLNTETKRKTPMVVYIKGDERLFGDSALTRGMKSPKNAYAYLLDLVGKTVDNPVVLQYKERFPYHTIEADPVHGTVVFRHDENTFFSVEELLAMQLENAVAMATAHGESPVSKIILGVPLFFNQREREAMLNVAEIAGVQVMQLMNTNAAVALQYAVFRNPTMTEKPMIVLFANVGSQFTTATVVSYSLQKDKNSGDKVPTVQVMGAGYDRTLGGMEMDLRLRDHLAKQFKEKYPKLSDITKNQRAMQKLLKEAKKVKTVLSANSETRAQVETLHEDKDFRTAVTRQDLMTLFEDLYPRFAVPFETAINTAGISKMEIEQVVLFGGGTRVPKIQEEILKVTEQKELHKYVNTDEAAALGAAFMAASTSSGFRTKDIKLKDANTFPFNVAFNKLVLNDEGEVAESKRIDKELYYRNNALPQKKAMTYTKFTDNFHFNVSYGDLSFLSTEQLSEFGVLPLMTVNVKGVQDVFNAHHDKTSKGIKAHIMVDESGVLSVDSVEAIFETKVANKTESGIWDSVSNFFGGNNEDVDGKPGGEKKEEAVKEGEKTANKTEEKTTDNTTKPLNETKEAKKEVIPDKPVIVKEILKIESTVFGIPRLLDTSKGKEKLAALKKIDDDKRATEEARNKLESFVISMKDVMQQDVYKSASTPEEMEKIMKALHDETEWMEEESWGETYVVFNARLAAVEDQCETVRSRVKEMEGRSGSVADLKQAFNLTRQFLAKMANTSEELRYHTIVEIDNLENLMNTTQDWLEKTSDAQSKLAISEDPVLKLADLKTKRQALERELYYLIRKPIPQWYKDKLADMMKKVKEGEKKEGEKKDTVTDDDLEVKEEDGKKKDDTSVKDEIPVEEAVPKTEDKKEEEKKEEAKKDEEKKEEL